MALEEEKRLAFERLREAQQLLRDAQAARATAQQEPLIDADIQRLWDLSDPSEWAFSQQPAVKLAHEIRRQLAAILAKHRAGAPRASRARGDEP